MEVSKDDVIDIKSAVVVPGDAGSGGTGIDLGNYGNWRVYYIQTA